MIHRNYDRYWATLEGEDLIEALDDKRRIFYDDLESKGIKSLLERCYLAYYGGDLESDDYGAFFRSNKIGAVGSNGKISAYKANHARNVVQHILNLVTANRPTLKSSATNTDAKSQAQTILGDGIVDYYMREKGLDRKLRKAVEMAIVQFEAWLYAPWEPNAGELYEEFEGQKIYEGDLAFYLYPMHRVIRDVNLSDDEEHKWVLIERRCNRWDKAAEIEESEPEKAEEIREAGERLKDQEVRGLSRYDITKDEDNVTEWVLLHAPTPALPEGRVFHFIDDIVTVDMPMPYRNLPVKRLAGADILGTPYGYTFLAELIAPQQGLDRMNTTIMSNGSTFGMQSVQVKGNARINVSQLGEGLKLFRIQDDSEIKPLQLTATPKEIFSFRDNLERDIERLSGINSTVRGEPPSQSSGAQSALMVSQAIQFSSNLEASYISMAEDAGTMILHHTRDFAQTQRVATIIGEANRPWQEYYQARDLDQINRVIAEIANPFSKTASGRLKMADTLLERGQIDAYQYMQILKTGNFETATDDPALSAIQLKAENEELRKGGDVQAIVTDHHFNHIRKHATILYSPEARRDPDIVLKTLGHIQHHYELWRKADPAMLFATGQQPPPPAGQMDLVQAQFGGGMPGGQRVGQEQNPMAQGMAKIPMNEPTAQGPVGQPDMPRMPNMPKMPNLPQGTPEEAMEAYAKLGGNSY